MSLGTVGQQVQGVLVWFEADPAGQRALAQAQEIALRQSAHLTVMTVATPERLIGCGRCLQGTALWNLEMKKIAHEQLTEARRLIADPDDVSYEVVIGDPVQAIVEMTRRTEAHTIVLPLVRAGRFAPPNRRNVGKRLAEALRASESGPEPEIIIAGSGAALPSAL